MSQKKKIILCIVLSVVIVFSTVTGVVCCVSNLYSSDNYASLQSEYNKNNRVDFNNDVLIADDSLEIQEDFSDVVENKGIYTLKYDSELPEFFKNMKKGDIFCVYPDDDSNKSFFSLGFCGEIVELSDGAENPSVSFKMPQLIDVFSDLYFSTKGTGNYAENVAFYPAENVSVKQQTAGLAKIDLQSNLLSSDTIGEYEIDFDYDKADSKSLLKDYTLLCDEIELEFSNEDVSGLSFGGSVTLEEPAIKMVVDYHYDKAKDKLKINEFDLGFITKQKIEFNVQGKEEFGFDDLDFSDSPTYDIIDIEDVTKSEKGKIVLGTYLIGYEAALPALHNDVNDVNYLSLGIAVQATLTGSGELCLQYNFEESGFNRIEIDSSGKKKLISKGYDYPNPVTQSRKPTAEEKNSKPEVTAEIKGEANLDLALGCDVGICILGMIPMKIATNFIEIDVTRSFSDKVSNLDVEQDEVQTIFENNYLMDDCVDSLIISQNSYFKAHLGASCKIGSLKHTFGKASSSVLLENKVCFQYPSPYGFEHQHCGFGNVFVGEKYTDDELKEAYNSYLSDVDDYQVLTSTKDFMIGKSVDAVLNGFNIDLFDVASTLGGEAQDYEFDYYTSGVIYVRDSNDVVRAAYIFGDDVKNKIGFHTSLSTKKVKQVYSIPAQSAKIEFEIGELLQYILGLDDVKDTNVTTYQYKSSNSKDKMDLLFIDDELELIMVYR